MTQREQEAILAFVASSKHGWTHQPTARVINAGFDSNPEALCVEITVMVGHVFSEETGDYRPETSRVFSMAGARVALGY